MNKTLKKIGIIVGALVVVLFVAFQILQSQTKKASPEATVTYQKNGADISVFYCRPSKKGRAIFGGLLPYGQVWRTGANEATTFSTSKDLTIGGKTLPAGKYTLWTVPNKDNWKVIFNSKQYDWGVSWRGVASRDAAADVLEVEVPVQTLATAQEMFTISFDNAASAMVLAWDTTSISVPLQ